MLCDGRYFVFQNTIITFRHHKIAEVDGTADLKMASSPTLPTLAPLTAHAWCVPLGDKG
jgi:hypothetical protein